MTVRKKNKMLASERCRVPSAQRIYLHDHISSRSSETKMGCSGSSSFYTPAIHPCRPVAGEILQTGGRSIPQKDAHVTTATSERARPLAERKGKILSPGEKDNSARCSGFSHLETLLLSLFVRTFEYPFAVAWPLNVKFETIIFRRIRLRCRFIETRLVNEISISIGMR